MKAIIIYKGKYGATRQYAEWLGYELNLPVVTANEINGVTLIPYDLLILGTSIYVGKFQLKSWLKHNLSFIRDKKIFLFQVAGTPPEETEKRENYNQQNIPPPIRQQCTVFNLPGRMNVKKLSWKDRWVLRMGARLAKDPADKANMLTDYDGVKKEFIRDIIRAVRPALNSVIINEAGKLVTQG